MSFHGSGGTGTAFMREMEFKMERPGLTKAGDRLKVTEGRVSTFYYYTIEHAIGMSANFTVTERLKCDEHGVCEGVVKSVEEKARGYYVLMEFDE